MLPSVANLVIWDREYVNLLRGGSVGGTSKFEHTGKSFNPDLPLYRVSIKYFPDYKHLLQENYVEYNFFFQNLTQEVFLQHIIQGEHKIFPWLQTFVTRKLRGIQKEHMLKCTNVL